MLIVNDYKFKTEPFDHQRERFYLYRDKEYHFHGWEQRTGKSKVSVDQAAYNYGQGLIQAVLLVAPNGVHLNWVRNEVPIHMPDYVGCEPIAYVSTPNAAQKKELAKLSNISKSGLRFLAINIEALNTEKGYQFALDFLLAYRCMMLVDEGSIIKTWTAKCTERVLKLSKHAVMRRVLNGTPVTQGPLDIFPQFLFLDDQILRTTNWQSFRGRYAILETQGKMKRIVLGKLREIAAEYNTYPWGDPILSEEKGEITAGQQGLDCGLNIDFHIRRAGKMQFNMYWRVGDDSGKKEMILEPGDVYVTISGYQRLDELQALILPHFDRVLKVDCLDLPPKLYQKRYVPLSTKQRRMYDDLKKRCVAEHNGRYVTASNALVKLLRLQQIVGGFYLPDPTLQLEFDFDSAGMLSAEALEELLIEKLDSQVAIPIDEHNPRLEALLDDIAQTDGKILIWARFKPELKMIADALRVRYGAETVGEAHGDQKSAERQSTIDSFQRDDSPLRFIVANPQCKGVSRGQNLCKASHEYYYSNSFSLEDRLQSEDRPHSPGQTVNLAVVDMVAPDTMDEKVIKALRDKKELADIVTGDKLIEWI